ncbi:MAG: hypothetical protein ACK4UN_18200 [Limisphaerales bacterium]
MPQTFVFSLLFLFTLCSLLSAQPKSEGPTYSTGFNTATRIGKELRDALKPALRGKVHSHPVALETDVRPFVKTVEYPDETEPLRLVFISVGFVDLMNNVSHAKAIDRIQPGYFQRYLVSLSDESGEFSLKDLPGIADRRYWTDDILNDQQSNFNQMVGMLIAIELSHHYSGRYKKYSDRLAESDNVEPINNILRPAEWEDALSAGVQNALDCGYGIDGLKVLYDAIEKMPKRPNWVDYFLPEHAQVAKLKKDLQKIENRYFAQ